MITSRCVSPAVKRLKPRFTVRLAAKVLLIAFAVADTPAYPQDIDQLLADAAAIESPLNRAWLCDESENLLAAPQTASNTVLEVQLMRTCVQTANDGSKLVAAEGRIRNLDSEQALNMGNAARMLQLSLNGKRNEAEQGIGSVLDTDFISPLEPWDVRDFSLAFSVAPNESGTMALEHPAQAGVISISIGNLAANVPAEADKTEENKSAPIVPEVSSIPTHCAQTADWFVPGQATSPLLAMDVTAACMISANRMIVEGTVTSVKTDNGIALPPAHRVFQLQLESQVLTADESAEATLAPDFAGALEVLSEKDFAVAFNLPADTTGPAAIIIPLQGSPMSVPIGTMTAAKGALIELELDSNPVDQTPAPVETEPPSSPVGDAQFRHDLTFDRKTVGALVSRASDGAQLIVTRGTVDNDLAMMLNGKHDTDEEYFTYKADPEGVSEVLLTFPNGGIAELAGLLIDARSRTVHSPVPSTVQIFASEAGQQGPWTDLGTVSLPDDEKSELALTFVQPVRARAVRIAMTSRTGYLMLSEIEAYEVQDPAGGSVLTGIEADLIASENGGRVVRFTSQEGGWEASNLLSPPKAWFPANGQLPQDLVFAFEGFREVSVSEISLDWALGDVEDWKPRVKVLVSSDPGPLGEYSELGLMEAVRSSDGEAQTVLALPTPTSLRWLKITLSEPGANRFSLRQLHVKGEVLGIRRPDTRAVQSLAQHDALPPEREPNDSITQAVELPIGTTLAGRSDAEGDLDFFAFDVPGPGSKVVSLTLTGRPWIRTRLELADASGAKLFTHDPLTAETEHLFTWLLEPGRYSLKLGEPPSGIAIIIDDSGSMGDAIFTAKEAARLFALSKRPDERVSLFGFSGPVRQLSPLTDDGVQLAQLVMDGIDQSIPSGTSIYDAVIAGMDSLSEAQGNRAIILLTDGEDVSSKVSYPEFWNALENRRIPIYAIGLGGAMRKFGGSVSTRLDHMLEAVALGTGGAYFDSPTAEDLPRVWEDIAARIRDRGGYTLRWDIPGDGMLAVRETGEEFVTADAMGDIMFVLDASGSMKARTDQGRARIDVARSIMFDMLKDIPDSARVGLRVYGATRPSEPKGRSCQDSVLMVPVGTGTQATATEIVAQIVPQGQTPIGRSLAAVVDDMPHAERGVVVLLTDGEETCDAEADAPFNPERVGQALLDAGIEVRVNIIGFDIDDPEVQQGLARIATASGGAFFPAQGEAGLRSAMREAFTAPVIVLDDLGQTIVETKVGAEASTLPAARYHLLIGGRNDLAPSQRIVESEETRVYINKEGDEIRVSSSSVLPGTPWPSGVRVNRQPAVNDEQQAKLDVLLIREINSRLPKTGEEYTYLVQAMLTDLGYDPGPADGKIGSATRNAIAEFIGDHALLAGDQAYDRNGTPNVSLWFTVWSVHLAALLRPILYGDDIPENIAATLRR